MNKNELYTIAFKKYKQGKHQSAFDIKDEFLDKYPIQDIRSLNIKAIVDLEVSSNFLQLDVDLLGTLNIKCGRCLEYFNLPIAYNTQLTVEISNHNTDLSEADRQISIDANEEDLALDKHFYDYIMLSIPYKPAHPKENGEYLCNPEMLEQLEKHSAGKPQEEIDPRWDKLKNIFNN